MGFCWSSYVLIDEKGDVFRRQYCPESISYKDLLYKNSVIGCLTAIYDTDVFGKVYMPTVRMRQDYCLWLRLLELSMKKEEIICGGLPGYLAKYRCHQHGMTSNKFVAAKYQWKVYRSVLKLGYFRSTIAMASYVKNGILDRA